MLALAYQGITYTAREKIIDLGPLKASVDKEKSIPLPPIVGVESIAGGAGVGHRRSSKVESVTVVVGDRRQPPHVPEFPRVGGPRQPE